jgi:predicted O-methyltransferase YrrM
MIAQALRRVAKTAAVARHGSTIRAYETIEGYLTPYEAVSLYRLASRLPEPSTVVEIGSWKGKSTYCLARGLRSGTVVAIDPFDASGEPGSRELYEGTRGEAPLLDQFVARMTELGVMDKIKVRRGFSSDFVGADRAIGLLFIDGDHSKEGCTFDFTNFAPQVAPGGFVALHDFDGTRADLGPTWVANNCILPSEDYAFVGLFDSLWVARKLRA